MKIQSKSETHYYENKENKQIKTPYLIAVQKDSRFTW